MAIKQSENENATGTQEFFADNPSDIANLPTNVDVGSTCLVVNSSEVYIFSPSGSWIKL